MKQQTVSLAEDRIQALVAALCDWAERHPEPDRVLLGFASGVAVSPRELAKAVSARTPEGQAFLQIVEAALDVASFEEILTGLGKQ